MPENNHFEIIAPIYERVIRNNGKKPYIKLLELPVDGKLLDAGGGTGRISADLSTYVQTVIVVDSVWGMLLEAKKKHVLNPLCSYVEGLPFEKNSFERIIMVDALHHVRDQKGTLAELWRVLAPGGILLIEEPDIRSGPVKLIAFMEKILLMRSHFLRAESIQRMLRVFAEDVSISYKDHNAFVLAKKT